jgi:5-methylcytosine-specific restriction endonuclease McrA
MDWDTLRRKDYTCQRCGAKGGKKGDRKVVAHHIIPRSEGGADELENLITLCGPCHGRTHPENYKLTPSASKNQSEIANSLRESFDDYDILVPVHTTGNQYAVIENRSSESTTINVWRINLSEGTCDCPREPGDNEFCVHMGKILQVHPANLYGRSEWALHHMIPLEGECWSPICVTDILNVPCDFEPNTEHIREFLTLFSL